MNIKGRTQRRGQGAKEDRILKARERLTSIDNKVFESNAERRQYDSVIIRLNQEDK